MNVHCVEADNAYISTSVEKMPQILVLSDIRLLRDCIVGALGPDRRVITADKLEDLLTTANVVAAKVILVDSTFPYGRDAVRAIRRSIPLARIFVFAITEVEESVIPWVEAGVAGYIPRSAGAADVAALLYDLLRGEQSCSARVAAGLLRRLADIGCANNSTSFDALTTRERQVAQLIGAGLSNKEIARHLAIGLATTKSHVHNLLAKMNVHGRGQVVTHLRGRPIDVTGWERQVR